MPPSIHTDRLNESGFVETTLKAIRGRTIHTYHTEGAGGGHAPDTIKACGERGHHARDLDLAWRENLFGPMRTRLGSKGASIARVTNALSIHFSPA